MSIGEQLDDALFLEREGRYKGALTTLMLAVAASSRRTFPKGTMSRENPKEKMSDREAFTLFLGGRIQKVLFGDMGGPDEGSSGISILFRGEHHSLSYILYKFFRCELVHDGELPGDVEFAPPKERPRMTVGTSAVEASISSSNKLILDYSWLNVLHIAVRYARCNGDEFGIQHLDLVPRDGIDSDEFLTALAQKYGVSGFGPSFLKDAVRQLSPSAILNSTDGMVVAKFNALIEAGGVHRGGITGMHLHTLSDRNGVLNKRGLSLIREIAAAYDLVEVS